MGTPTYIPQNDPHDTLIILNIHNWGKIFFKKNLPISSSSHQPRSDPEVGLGSKSFFVFFPFLNSPQNSEYFEYSHTGSNKKISPCRMLKTKSPAPTKPVVLYSHFGVCRRGGGGTLGSGPDQEQSPWHFLKSKLRGPAVVLYDFQGPCAMGRPRQDARGPASPGSCAMLSSHGGAPAPPAVRMRHSVHTRGTPWHSVP